MPIGLQDARRAMLTRIVAYQFDRPATRGRTQPIFLTCLDAADEDVEVVAKLSSRCDEKAVNLAREAIAACLAADLGLPLPRPYLVDLPAVWIASVTDAPVRQALSAGCPVAFGSRLVGRGFTVWNQGMRLHPVMVPAALGILAFDGITANPDRRSDNPNCLVRGEELRIFDHELTFTHHLTIPSRKPWQAGSMNYLMSPGSHIFRDKLRGQELNFAPIRAAWAALSDGRIASYGATLPLEWAGIEASVTSAVQLIKDARDRIDDCLAEVQRVLT